MIAAGHSDMKAREVTALESALGYQFKRQELLEQALTHSSRAREQEAIDVPPIHRPQCSEAGG